MDDDPDRSTGDNVIDRLVAWSNHQLYLMGRMARAGTLHPKPLERFLAWALTQLTTERAPSIRFTIRRRVAHISLRRTWMGILCLERTIPFLAGASRAERSEPVGELRRSASPCSRQRPSRSIPDGDAAGDGG